jgi:hypothetical protein
MNYDFKRASKSLAGAWLKIVLAHVFADEKQGGLISEEQDVAFQTAILRVLVESLGAGEGFRVNPNRVRVEVVIDALLQQEQDVKIA